MIHEIEVGRGWLPMQIKRCGKHQVPGPTKSKLDFDKRHTKTKSPGPTGNRLTRIRQRL